MALFEAIVNIAARTADIEAGVKSVEDKFSELGEYAKKAGEVIGVAFSAELFKSFIEGAVDSGDALAKAAEKAGANVEQFSALAYAAKQSEVSIESLSTGIKFMQKSIENGNVEFKNLGISMDDLKGKSPIDQLELLADRISAISDPAQKTAAILQLFGRAGTDLIPLFDQGSDGIKKFTDEAERLGLTLDENTVKELEQAKQAVNLLSAEFDKLGRAIASSLVTTLQQFSILSRSPEEKLSDLVALQKVLTDQISASNEAIAKSANNNWFENIFSGASPAVLQHEQQELANTTEQIKKLQDQLEKKTLINDGMDVAAINNIIVGAQKATLIIDAYNLKVSQGAFAEGAKWLDDYSASLDKANKLTQTSQEKTESADAAFLDSVNLLVKAGEITAQEGNLRVADYIQKSLDSITDEFKGMQKKHKEAFDQMGAYTKEAAQSMQNAMEDFFFDPFSQGITGLLTGFLNAIRRMLAEAAAAKLANVLFGSKQSDGSQSSGLLGGFLSGLIGAKADGGSVSAGSPYIVGERGPELFMPGSSGTIVPNHALGGSGSIVINMPIDARGATQDAIALLPSVAKHASDDAVSRILYMKRQGKL